MDQACRRAAEVLRPIHASHLREAPGPGALCSLTKHPGDSPSELGCAATTGELQSAVEADRQHQKPQPGLWARISREKHTRAVAAMLALSYLQKRHVRR